LSENSECGGTSQGATGAYLTIKHVYRFKRPLHRPLVVKDKPMRIHPSVKARYLADSAYRPTCLRELVERDGWDNLDVGE
jgi:hypothetical protein